LIEPAVVTRRRHEDDTALVLDMLFVQAYKAHVSVRYLVELGHMEDAATITRRLLELATTSGYIGTADPPSNALGRARRFLADLWLDLPTEARSVLPLNAQNYWNDLVGKTPRGALPSFQKMFSVLGHQGTYGDDYSILARVAHGASSDQLVAFARNTVPVRPLDHLGPVLAFASRYALATADVWNGTFHVIDAAALQNVAIALAAWPSSDNLVLGPEAA